MMQLIAMHGYGAYIWPCYAFTLLVFVINGTSAWREQRKIKHFLKQYFKKNEPSS